jgi:hypothetical protein
VPAGDLDLRRGHIATFDGRPDRRLEVGERTSHRVDEEDHAVLALGLTGQALLVIDDIVGDELIDPVEVSFAEHLVVEGLNQLDAFSHLVSFSSFAPGPSTHAGVALSRSGEADEGQC